MKRFVLMLAALIVFASTSEVRAGFLVVPNQLENVEGNSNNGFPFNIARFSFSSMRYQQAYASSAFSAVSGPILITQITFRPDAGSGNSFSSTLPDIQINLSTTSRGPDNLSSTFALNVGANDTVVYQRGSLALSSADTGPAGGPKDFDIVINLTTPFVYDPSQGHLLLDVRNFGGGARLNSTPTPRRAIRCPEAGLVM